jgi:PKD repeat protein
MTTIKELIAKNPGGLLEMKRSMTILEYRDNYGFGLKNTFTIYEAKESHISGKEWFASQNKTLETLFNVQEETNGDLLVVYIVETIKNNTVRCHMILSDEAYKNLIKDSHVVKVHQMYSKFWRDHIAMNMN